MAAVAIDWSGAKQPRGKLWLGHAVAGELVELRRLNGRRDAADQLVERLRQDRGAVGGLDFAFSFPEWFVRRHAGDVDGFWRAVERHGETWLAECPPPFWGRRGHRKPDSPEPFRRTESQMRPVGGISPKSCFQIGGAGAVGTGSIRGIPWLRSLRAAGIAVWPFDPPVLPLVVEIYPRLLTGAVTRSSRAARVRYLEREWPGLGSLERDAATSSEDAFDAAVSALVMDRHIERFRSLPPPDDIARIEGAIWGSGVNPAAPTQVHSGIRSGTGGSA